MLCGTQMKFSSPHIKVATEISKPGKLVFFCNLVKLTL